MPLGDIKLFVSSFFRGLGKGSTALSAGKFMVYAQNVHCYAVGNRPGPGGFDIASSSSTITTKIRSPR